MAAGLLCWAAVLALLLALIVWQGFCESGTFERCANGKPSFELVFQAVLAGAGFAGSLVTWLLVRSRSSYAPAGAAFATTVLLFAGWAIFLDAATHGWDDLKLLWLG
jgi:hypothetical protein